MPVLRQVKRVQGSARELLERTHEVKKRTHRLERDIDRANRTADEAHHRVEMTGPALGRRRPGFPIVGLGAATGGLEAVTELLQVLPPNPSMALVVMQHLDPTHESALPSRLGRATDLPITEAKRNLRLDPNRVYVTPPNKTIRVGECRLKVKARKTGKEVRMPIDEFLESLANGESDRAIGVILSGNGSDGTRGLLAVKTAGGITFAQDEKTAKYTAMPASAVVAGYVDFVLPPARIVKELVALVGRPVGAEVPPVPSPGTTRRIARTGQMREELAATRESLQAIIEEQKATNEVLRSANEEIMPSNQELQSTNEELETAKEELQSTNEGLTTLNDELASRNAEVENVNNDLHDLLASANIPIVFVSPDLRIRRLSNVAEKLLNLIPGDVGRPITDIKMRLGVPKLDKLISEVIDSFQTKDMEVQDNNNCWWSVRIRPCKTTDQKIDGAVVAIAHIDLLRNPLAVKKGSMTGTRH